MVPRSCQFSYHSRRESAAEAVPLDFWRCWRRLSAACRHARASAVCILRRSIAHGLRKRVTAPIGDVAMPRHRSSPHSDPPYKEQDRRP